MNKRLTGVLLTLAFIGSLAACSADFGSTDVSRQEMRQQDKLQPDEADHETDTEDAQDETSAERVVDHVEAASIKINLGEPLKMPQRVHVVYNEHSLNGLEDVVWDESQTARVRTDKAGEYTINGTIKGGIPAICRVIVEQKNWVRNPGFEQNDISMWKVSYKGSSNPTKIQAALPARTGMNSFSFKSSEKQDFQIEQTVFGLKTGSCTASADVFSENLSPSDKIYLYVKTDGRVIRSKLLDPDKDRTWQTLKIKNIPIRRKNTDLIIGVKVKCCAGGSGAIDSFSLTLNEPEQ